MLLKTFYKVPHAIETYFAPLLFVALISFSGCSRTADSEFDANYGMASDGSSLYAVGNRTASQTTVAKFDGDSGDMIWSTTIGSTRRSGTIAEDGYLWVAMDEEAGIDTPIVDDERDWLLKISPETGDIVDKIATPHATLTPEIEVDGEFWLQNALEEVFEVVDIKTGEITDTIQVNNDTFSESGVADITGSPIILGDDLWLADPSANALIRSRSANENSSTSSSASPNLLSHLEPSIETD